jgi:hypothetical protein
VIEVNIIRSEMSVQSEEFQGMKDGYKLLKEQSIDHKESIIELTIQLDEAYSKAAISYGDLSSRREEVHRLGVTLATERKEFERFKQQSKVELDTLRCILERELRGTKDKEFRLLAELREKEEANTKLKTQVLMAERDENERVKDQSKVELERVMKDLAEAAI